MRSGTVKGGRVRLITAGAGLRDLSSKGGLCSEDFASSSGLPASARATFDPASESRLQPQQPETPEPSTTISCGPLASGMSPDPCRGCPGALRSALPRGWLEGPDATASCMDVNLSDRLVRYLSAVLPSRRTNDRRASVDYISKLPITRSNWTSDLYFDNSPRCQHFGGQQ